MSIDLRCVGVKPIGIAISGRPACGPLGTEPTTAITGPPPPLGSFIIFSIASWNAFLRTGRLVSYSCWFLPPGVAGVAELQPLLRVGEVDFDLLGEAFDGCRRTEVRVVLVDRRVFLVAFRQ